MKTILSLVVATLLTSCVTSTEMLRITECSPSNAPSKTLLEIKGDSKQSRRLIGEAFSYATSIEYANRIHIRPIGQYIRIDIFCETDIGLQQAILESDHPVTKDDVNFNIPEGVTKDEYRKFRRIFDSIRSQAEQYRKNQL